MYVLCPGALGTLIKWDTHLGTPCDLDGWGIPTQVFITCRISTQNETYAVILSTTTHNRGSLSVIRGVGLGDQMDALVDPLDAGDQSCSPPKQTFGVHTNRPHVQDRLTPKQNLADPNAHWVILAQATTCTTTSTATGVLATLGQQGVAKTSQVTGIGIINRDRGRFRLSKLLF